MLLNNRLLLLCGGDIPFPEASITIHVPTLQEISYIGEQTFFTAAQTFTINKNLFGEGNFELDNTSNFQIFMTIMKEQETRDKKEAIITLFQLIFPQCQVIMTPMSILLNKEGQQTIVDENNFEILQEIIKEIFCVNSGPMDQATFNPADEKAREIAEKLMRGRQRVAEQKGETNSSAFGRYLSILTIGLNAMPLSEAMNLTMYQLYDLVERYTLYLNWDLDIRTRLAGGKPDSKPDDWMKNIH